MHQARKKFITANLCIIWILTIISGMLGVWHNITVVLLPVITGILSIVCITSMTKKKYGNICLGICGQYFSVLCLLSAYKVAYWQFGISFWWLVTAYIILILIDMLILWRFLKSGKNIKKKKSVYPLAVALLVYPIVIVLGKYLKALNSNDIAVAVMSMCLIVLATMMTISVRHLVLDDTTLLVEPKNNSALPHPDKINKN